MLEQHGSDETRSFRLEHSEVVFVSIGKCDEALERIYSRMQDCHLRAEHHVILNCGVAASRPGFDLENVGKNFKNFGIPDEEGNQP